MLLHTFVLDPHILVGIGQYFRHGNTVFIARQTMFTSVIVHFPVSNLHYFVKFPFGVGNLHSSRKFSYYEAILHIPYVSRAFRGSYVARFVFLLGIEVVHSWCYYVFWSPWTIFCGMYVPFVDHPSCLIFRERGKSRVAHLPLCWFIVVDLYCMHSWWSRTRLWYGFPSAWKFTHSWLAVVSQHILFVLPGSPDGLLVGNAP